MAGTVLSRIRPRVSADALIASGGAAVRQMRNAYEGPMTPGIQTRRVLSRRLVALWAALRIALGVVALAKPRLASRAWVGPDAAHGLTPVVLGRAAGGRDIALGAGAVACTLTGAPLRLWVLAGGGADAVDAEATWSGGPDLPRGRRTLFTVVSAASALTAAFLATQVDRRPFPDMET
jgi:hypothetical protein